MSALGTLAGRLARHAAIYGAGSTSALLFGVVQLAVLTRLLDLAAFGQLAVLLVVSTLLTVAYNLGTLQGSMRYVFGAADEDEDGAVSDEEADRPAAGDKRRALATAIAITAAVGATGTLALVAAAPVVAELLLGDRGAATAVIWMAVAAALGSVWRLVMFALRMERRPGSWALVNLARPVLVVAAVIPLAAVVGGVAAVMAGVAVGTALGLGVALWAARHSWRPALSRTDATAILGRGWEFAPVVIAFWVLNSADVLLLSRYASDADVGVYRVASRVGAVMAYAGSAFLMSFAPFTRTPIYSAVDRERGWLSAGGVVVVYFTLGMVGLVLLLALAADVLVRVAPPEYGGAAALVPLVGLGFALHAMFRLALRLTRFPRKRLAFVGLAIALAPIYIGVGLVLIPALGSYGAALSLVVAAGFGVVTMLALSQAGPQPLEVEWRRVAIGVGAAAGCVAAAKGLGPLAGSLAPAVDLLALLAYPVLLVRLGAIRRAELAVLRSMVASLLPARAATRRLEGRLADLSDRDHALLRALARNRERVDDVAAAHGMSRPDLLARFTGALRTLAELSAADVPEERVGEHLLSRAPVAERDDEVKRLLADGVDPLELDALTLTFERLRKLPAAAWDRASEQAGERLPRPVRA